MKNGKILIIDDNPLYMGFLCGIFSNTGIYKSDIAVNGLEGIEKIKNKDYDIVFSGPDHAKGG